MEGGYLALVGDRSSNRLMGRFAFETLHSEYTNHSFEPAGAVGVALHLSRIPPV